MKESLAESGFRTAAPSVTSSTTTPPQVLDGKSEDELAAMAQRQHRAAFEELYRRLFPRLLRFLEARLVHRRTEAEEIAQEAFLKAWTSIESFKTQYRFSTWLYTIAWRTAIDSEKRLAAVRLNFVHPMVDPQPSVERQVAAREQLDNIWEQAKVRLSSDQYAALWLRYAEDMSVSEIASVMRKSSIGVRVLLHRARGKLQEVVGDADARSSVNSKVLGSGYKQ